jgi:ComF family protein
LVDLIFPPTCGGCGELGVRWCQKCQQTSKKIQPPICAICGQPIQAGEICTRCAASPPKYAAVRSWAEFDGPVRNALHALKYRKNIGLGGSLAQSLAESIQTYDWDVHLITPVPLGSQREQQRGYNQAALIAQPLALQLQLPYNPRILERTRETQSQVDLSLRERQKNLAGAFRSQPKTVDGKIVLIIDDVTTSGSTLNACADALIQVGAQTVYGLTVARAVLKN